MSHDTHDPTPHKPPGHGLDVWVVPSRAGGFDIKVEGRLRPLIHGLPQRFAIDVAREIARAYGSELIVQGTTGRIRLRDSHGADPITRKG